MHRLAVHTVLSTISIEFRQYDCRSIQFVCNALPGKLLRCSLDHVPLFAVHSSALRLDVFISPRNRGLRQATYLTFDSERDEDHQKIFLPSSRMLRSSTTSSADGPLCTMRRFLSLSSIVNWDLTSRGQNWR